MKYKDNFNEDYNFYLNNISKFNFCGEVVETPKYSESGVDAKNWFFIFDSNGKKKAYLTACKEPSLAKKIVVTKKSINMHLKMWAEGYNDCLMGVQDYISSFNDPKPEWVTRSLINLRTKKYFKTNT